VHEKRRQNSPAAQTVAFFFHNADSAGLRVATLPARFTPKENPAYAGSWKIVIIVHTPLSREVFWNEYANIPLPQAIWNEFWLRYCERSEQ